MPTPRRYTSHAERQAAYRKRQADARQQELQKRGLPPLPAIATVPGSRRWNALIRQAACLLQTVETEMQDYYEERSEAWQDSEKGEEAAERLEAVGEVVLAIEGLLP